MKHTFLIAFVIATILSPQTEAQEAIHLASVSGSVTDPSGAAVVNAKVAVRQVETNLTARGETDSQGRFRLSFLRAGEYEVRISKAGFADTNRKLTLTVGAAFDLPVSLSIAAAETSLDVVAETAILEAARSQIAGKLQTSEVNSLPLNGRNYLDLALLIPGVSPTNTASTQLFAETSAVPGQGISVGSQRNLSNNFVVDGLSANDDAAALAGTFYGLGVVQEFQVVTSGGQSEFGRALGGYVSMVTRSGTNGLHGEVYGFLRNQRFNAANALSNSKLPLTQMQHGASIGGPIVRDRTFFFGNFEQLVLNQSGLITILPANVSAINARLASVGYLGPLVTTGQYQNPVHNVTALGKVDHQVSSRDLFSLRYSVYKVNSDNSRGAGALNAVSAAAGLANTDHNFAASNILTISPRMVNETRGQYVHSDLEAFPNDLLGPSISISGVATLGRLAGSPTGRLNHLFELTDNLSKQSGAHALRGGVNFLFNRTTITYPRQIRGSYSFASLANFLTGTYNNLGYGQTFGNSIVEQSNPNLGLYAQDEWRVTRRLTLNLGVRYDLQFLESIHTDTNNISPRAGFAWSPFASRKTVVRGSFGLFYDRVPLRALANALLSANNSTVITSTSQLSITLSPTQTGAPRFPAIIPTLLPGVLANLTTMDRNMQNAYSTQGSLEIEQQIGSRGAFSVSYQHMRGLHLIMSINQNVPACAAAGNNNACRPNPNYANNSQYSPRGDSQYDGLHVSYVQRPGKWSSYRVSYTYSKALNNVGEFFFSGPINNFDVWQDWARSDDDQRHRVVVDGTLHSSMTKAQTPWQRLSNGFQLGGMLQYYSALPFNITTGATTIQGTTARPVLNGDFIGRNVGKGFDLFTVNARLSRSFRMTEKLKLDAIAEAFNLLNHRNDMIPNGVFSAGVFPGSPSTTFGRPNAVGDPRTMQFALKLLF